MRQKRNEMLIKILLHQFKNSFKNKELLFADIYIGVSNFKNMFSSFYELITIKKKCVHDSDKFTYQYLNRLVLHEVKVAEIDQKAENFKLDDMMEIDF